MFNFGKDGAVRDRGAVLRVLAVEGHAEPIAVRIRAGRAVVHMLPI